jgi:hypothetical protein
MGRFVISDPQGLLGPNLELTQAITVAILAQGTSWAVAVTQAFLS